MKYFSILALLFLLLLSSCATKGQTGAVGGAAAGADLVAFALVSGDVPVAKLHPGATEVMRR